MTEIQLTKDNHYVSQGYLKQWALESGKVFVFRRLVSHRNVPLWELKSVRGIGYQEHLYTQQIAGDVTDQIERWFSDEFETPAEESIQRAVTGQRLSSDDWRNLVRFLALHDVRTPARLVDYLNTASETMNEVLASVLSDLPEKLAEMKRGGAKPPVLHPQSEAFPLRVTTEIKEGEKFGTLKAETAVGRALWLWTIRHYLNSTVQVLHKHRWTIIRPAAGERWLTSDNPVIRLNYYGPGNYDFKGGWGRSGGEIIFPLSPEHLLYTRVGDRPPTRGTRFSIDQTQLIRRIIAEHSHRYIFGETADVGVAEMMPRTVDADMFRQEEAQWAKWHSEQLESERYLSGEKKRLNLAR